MRNVATQPSADPKPLNQHDGRRVLLLDLDGVLVDTRPIMRVAWQAVQEQYRVGRPFEDYEQHLGRPFTDIMAQLELGDVAAIHETYAEASRAAAHLARPFSGIPESLHAFVAEGWLLGVVTSKPLNRAAPILAQLGCPFTTVQTPDGRTRGKPAPDPLLLALLALSADPGWATYVGDTPVDGEAASRAGMNYIHAAWGYGAPAESKPLVAHAPGDLFPLLTGRHLGPFLEGSPL